MTTPVEETNHGGKAGPVGIIGFGLVGAACARRLSDAGDPPYVVEPDARAVRSHAAIVRTALTPDQLVQTCRVALVCVYSTGQVFEVLRQLTETSRSVDAALHTVMCVTTLDPDSVHSLTAMAAAGGLTFIEYPMSGTSVQIRDGHGLGLLSGDDVAIGLQRSLIETLTPRWHVLGPSGSASLAKLAVNLVLEVNRSALAEGLVFATGLGLDQATFLAALTDSAAYSRVMDGKAPKMLAGDFDPEGRAAQSLKDVEMMLSAATGFGQSLPMASAQAALLRAAVDAGDGDLDSSVVYRTIAALRH